MHPGGPVQADRRTAGVLAPVDRLTNRALGALLVVVLCSGLVANTLGTPLLGRWVVVLHGAAGLGLVVLSRRKSRIARRSLGRPRRRPGSRLSLVLAALVVLTVATGLLHSTGLTDRLGPLTLMQVHIGAAVAVVPLAVQHVRRRPQRPARPAAEPSRRAVLQGAAVTVAAGGLWSGWEGGLRLTAAPGAARRFTGSHERGSGDPYGMPVTQWLDDRVQVLDPVTWHLDVAGERLTLADVRSLPQEDVVATLDCTSLWWSEQTWRGVRLDRLVELAGARSLEVQSATGYRRLFPADDLSRTWLALECGGRPLSAGHGAPARVVAPGRRGFWWVKWVAAVEPSDTPWWRQPPYPLT